MIICPPWRVLRLPWAEERLGQAGGEGKGSHSQNNENIREEVKPDSQPDEGREKFGGTKKRGERGRRGERKGSEVNKDNRKGKSRRKEEKEGYIFGERIKRKRLRGTNKMEKKIFG